MTKREMFNEIIDLAVAAERDDIVEFVEKELELLAKRNSKESKAAKAKAEERQALAENILEVLANAENPMRTMEIATIEGISPQKATPILKELLEKGKVVAGKVKGATVYSLAD